MIETEQSRVMKDAARADLSRYRQAQRDIEHLKQNIGELEARAEVHGLAYDQDQVQCSGNMIEELLCLIADQQTKYHSQIIEAERICKELSDKVDTISNPLYRRILRDHWLFGRQLAEIADREHYSLSYITMTHSIALENYGKKYFK